MARVRDISPGELPPEPERIHEQFASAYGPLRNQVAPFARVPALRHQLPLLMALREAATRPKRSLELALSAVSQVAAVSQVGAVSQVNACDYCLAHHKPFLAVEGVSPAGAERLLDSCGQPPELNEVDRLVVEYALVATDRPNLLPEALFARLRRHFTEAQLVELTLRITSCGFFNEFSDAAQIEGEPEAMERFAALAE